MPDKIKKRILWAAGTAGALSLFYILGRHDVLGGWHDMRQWPSILFIFGLVVIAIAAFFYCRKVMIGAAAGYIAGFALAWLFNTDGVDPGGGATNNAWIIWTVTLLVLIFAGAVWDTATKYVIKKN